MERDGRRVVVVTVRAPDSGASRHSTTYVLTPSRVPGGTVSMALGTGAGQVLKKQD